MKVKTFTNTQKTTAILNASLNIVPAISGFSVTTNLDSMRNVAKGIRIEVVDKNKVK
jgi:uncharacterized protein YjgD (DUF1641 family)